jgi:hypothetical protein
MAQTLRIYSTDASFLPSFHDLWLLRTVTVARQLDVMTALLRARYPFIPPSLSVSHIVVGGGVVGLAVGERLVKGFANRTTFVVERCDILSLSRLVPLADSSAQQTRPAGSGDVLAQL